MLVLAFGSLLFPTLVMSTSSVSTGVYKSEACSTQFGMTKTTTPIPHTTYATTIHSHTTVGTISTVTGTQSASTKKTTKTKTVTVTVTDSSTVTDTYTSTIVATSTTTDGEVSTTTFTATMTATTTSTAAAITIPEPAGFTPIGAQNPARMRARAAELADFSGENIIFGEHGGPVIQGRAAYPTMVVCTIWKTSVTTTYTATSTTTVTGAAATTSTVEAMTTTTSTSTVQSVDASSTTTMTSTTMMTVTSTSIASTTTTTTTTTTVMAAVGTVYAVCEDPENYIDTYMGNPINYGSAPYGIVGFTQTDNAKDCCNACQANLQCGSSGWVEKGSYTNTCAFVHYGALTCDPTNPSGMFYTDAPQYGFQIMVMNGQCGESMYSDGTPPYYPPVFAPPSA